MVNLSAKLTVGAVGQYALGGVSPSRQGYLVLHTRLASGTGITFGLRKRLLGTGPGNTNPGVTTVTDANAPRTYFTDFLTGSAVTNATAITPTSTAAIHRVDCDGCEIILDILTNSGSGVLEVYYNFVSVSE